MTLTTRPKKPKHLRKVQGKHHRRGKHYLQPYWPYLPLFLIVAGGLVLNGMWASRNSVLGQTSDMSTQTLLTDTNAERKTDHEDPLAINSRLTDAAEAKAQDMVTHNYWSHNTPDGKTPWSFIIKSGYEYQAAGENLAYGFDNSSDVITAWMNSSEHRTNILNNKYQNVGFGIAESDNYNNSGPSILVVAMYGEPTDASGAKLKIPSYQSAPANFASFSEPTSESISRVQLLTAGNAPWSLLAIAGIVTAALLAFLVRHGLLWKKVLIESEEFIIRHPYLDILAVSLVMLGYILTRTSGLIR